VITDTLQYRDATISDDGLYRYDLTRTWLSGPHALWIMLNPSTADADLDDPTIRRVMGFTRREGFGGCLVVNLYPLRVTKPAHLADHPDPVGPENSEHITRWLAAPNVGLVVAAWGAWSMGGRAAVVATHAARAERRLHCLGTTKNGSPRHPLYLPRDALLQAWHGVRSCMACGCTDDRACPGGCYWVGPALCSECA
jgi:hypothetical protein